MPPEGSRKTPDGLLFVDKARGITSHDVVDLVRRRGRVKKVGHSGTLDPLATGLLILCVGRATRLQSYLMNMAKTYEGTIQFGWATDTFDAEGTAAGERREVEVTAAMLEPLLDRFRGEIEQQPPSFSAKKVGGVRAYALARKGETPLLKPKRVTISSLEILSVDASRAEFRVRCSSGTYVRSIAHDLGQATGLGAHLCRLRRTLIGSFAVEPAIASSRIQESTSEEIFVEPHFLGISQVDLPLEKVVVDRGQEAKIVSGQSIIVKPEIETLEPAHLVRITTLDGELLAIGEVTEVLRAGGGPVVIQPRVVLRGE